MKTHPECGLYQSMDLGGEGPRLNKKEQELSASVIALSFLTVDANVINSSFHALHLLAVMNCPSNCKLRQTPPEAAFVTCVLEQTH